MAPEQAEGRLADINPATDVWALGAILYELLTGSPPFGTGSLRAVLHAICAEEPVRPSAARPGVPPGLDAICLRCLRKPPGERYARAADLAEDLRRWLAAPENAPLAGDPRGGAAPDAGIAPPTRSPSRGGPVSGKRRGLRRRWLAAAGLLLGGLGAVGAWAWLGRSASVEVAPADPGSGPGEQAEPVGKPLTIGLRVRRFAPAGDNDNGRYLGELGEGTFRVRFTEDVDVEATLSEPAFAYLIAFNPAEKPEDQEQLIPKDEANVPPPNRDRLRPDKRLGLDDGVGLQAFAVVASRQPLPAYAKWRKHRPPLGWQKMPASSGVVWRSNGGPVLGLYEPAFDRATEKATDKALVGKLARTLKDQPGLKVEAVAVIGFAVDRAD
jgi:hypothetical protein